jgi:hypothetical protein
VVRAEVDDDDDDKKLVWSIPWAVGALSGVEMYSHNNHAKVDHISGFQEFQGLLPGGRGAASHILSAGGRILTSPGGHMVG